MTEQVCETQFEVTKPSTWFADKWNWLDKDTHFLVTSNGATFRDARSGSLTFIPMHDPIAEISKIRDKSGII